MREINWDEELSDEDRAWAEQRPDASAGGNMLIRDKLAEHDERFGTAAKNATKNRAARIRELQAQIADAQNEIERLTVEQANEDNQNVAVTGDPSVGLVVDNTAVDGQKPEGAPEQPEDYSDTKYWTVARLQQEIQARNVDRKAANLQEMSDQGKRAELVERLQQDDAELAESED